MVVAQGDRGGAAMLGGKQAATMVAAQEQAAQVRPRRRPAGLIRAARVRAELLSFGLIADGCCANHGMVGVHELRGFYCVGKNSEFGF